MYTRTPSDPYLGRFGPLNGRSTPQKEISWVLYIYIYIYIFTFKYICLSNNNIVLKVPLILNFLGIFQEAPCYPPFDESTRDFISYRFVPGHPYRILETLDPNL